MAGRVIADRGHAQLPRQAAREEVHAAPDHEERRSLMGPGELAQGEIGIGARPVVEGEGDRGAPRAPAVDRKAEFGQMLDARDAEGVSARRRDRGAEGGAQRRSPDSGPRTRRPSSPAEDNRHDRADRSDEHHQGEHPQLAAAAPSLGALCGSPRVEGVQIGHGRPSLRRPERGLYRLGECFHPISIPPSRLARAGASPGSCRTS